MALSAGSYIVITPFGGYLDGQIVTLDAATATAHANQILPLGGVITSPPGTGTSTGGTITLPATGQFVTSVQAVTGGLVVTQVDSGGNSTTGTIAVNGLSPAQSALLMSVGSIVNASNQVTATVVGDVSGATVGGVLESSIAASVTSHGASLSAIGLTLASHGTSLSTLGTQTAAASSMAGSASALASTLGSTVTSQGMSLTSLSGSVSTLGTQVAAAKPVNGSSVVGTSAGGTLNYALTSTVGGTTSTLTTLAIPPGTLGSGDVSGNIVTTLTGGKSALLSALLGTTRLSTHYGTQNNTSTPKSVMGFNTRSDMYNYMNPSGNRPYAFMQNYPVSSGDDVRCYVPAGNTTATTTLTLATTITLPAAASGYTGPTGLYTGVDGYSYLYLGTATDPSRTYTKDQFVSDAGGKLAAGTIVVSTHTNCIRISTQPAGTALAAGASVTIGANMAGIAVGQQCFAPQGLIAPRDVTHLFPTITAKSGNIVTLSSALFVSSQSNGSGGYTDGNSYGQMINGLQPLSVLLIFTPVAEASITATMTMDDLAALALYFNTRKGDQSNDIAYLTVGDHYQGVPWYMWGKNTSIVGADAQSTYIRTRCSSFAVITVMPPLTAKFKVRGFSICTSDPSKTQYAGVYIEGANESQPTLNNLADIAITVDVGDITVQGPTQAVKLRHVGGDLVERVSNIGKGGSALGPSCALSLQNVVYCEMRGVGGSTDGAVVLVEGYTEHLVFQLPGDVSCASYLDMDAASTLPGTNVGCLILEVRSSDLDWQIFGLRIAFAQSIVIVGGEIQAPNTPAAFLPGRTTAPIISLEACDKGVVSGLVCGGNGQVDAIQIKARNLDGAPFGTDGVYFSGIVANGLAAVIRCDAGCNGNFFDDGRIFLNGSTSGAIVDNGTNTHISGTPADFADPGTNFYFGQIPKQNVGTSQATIVSYAAGNFSFWNSGTSTYTTPYGGYYEMEAEIDFADTGTAAVTGPPAFNAAAAAGTRFLISFLANGNALFTADATTTSKSTSAYAKWRAYVGPGVSLTAAIAGDAAGLIVNGFVSFSCTQRTF